jgi:hypothetical protein
VGSEAKFVGFEWWQGEVGSEEKYVRLGVMKKGGGD